MQEFDTVVLKRDLPDVRLRTGDIGAIVHHHVPGGYEVEFVTGGGDTVAALTLTDHDVRPLAPGEILHARAPWMSPPATWQLPRQPSCSSCRLVQRTPDPAG